MEMHTGDSFAGGARGKTGVRGQASAASCSAAVQQGHPNFQRAGT